jgi:hypothetical protein
MNTDILDGPLMEMTAEKARNNYKENANHNIFMEYNRIDAIIAQHSKFYDLVRVQLIPTVCIDTVTELLLDNGFGVTQLNRNEILISW